MDINFSEISISFKHEKWVGKNLVFVEAELNVRQKQQNRIKNEFFF